MKSPVAPALTYPTPAMQTIFDEMRGNIRLMRQWHGVPPGYALQGAITEVTPSTVLDTLEAVVDSVEPALRFYLNYPTQRLSVFLRNFIDEANRFVSWLCEHGGESQDPLLNADFYQQAADNLRASLQDWHNSLLLAGIQHELDMDTPEIQH
jgi:hypothetical protein